MYPFFMNYILFQIQKYAEANGGQTLNLEEWDNLYNISNNVGNGLLESGVVKMMVGYVMFFSFVLLPKLHGGKHDDTCGIS